MTTTDRGAPTVTAPSETTPTPGPGAPDPRPHLDRALAQLRDVVAVVTDADLDRATPCEGWDVRTLLNHLVAVHRRMTHVAGGGVPLDLPSVSEVPDGAHAPMLTAERATVRLAWGIEPADEDVLDREVTVPWGRVPGRIAGFGYVQELTVHAWDLAAPLGRVGGLDPALAEAVLVTSQRILPAEGREHTPFGPVVDVPSDAGPYARLAGWLGREPADPVH